VLGPRYTHGHVFDFVQRLKKNPHELRVLGNGYQNKSYMHVDDCIQGIISLRGTNRFETFNLGRPNSIVIRDSIKIITNSLNIAPNILYGDGQSGWIGDNPHILLDVEKAKLGAAFHPRKSGPYGLKVRPSLQGFPPIINRSYVLYKI
jgi:UDP-glucose 4-epimerase